MTVNELIGKTITDIRVLYENEVGGLDKAESFIELDNHIIIDIPYASSTKVWIKENSKNASSIFNDFADSVSYSYRIQPRKNSFLNRFYKAIFGRDLTGIKLIRDNKVVHDKPNQLLNMKDRKIIDVVWYDDDSKKAWLLLDNGWLMTEICTAPHGTGLAGLRFLPSLAVLSDNEGKDFRSLTEH